MKIIICASTSFIPEVIDIKKKLGELGHIVEIPFGFEEDFKNKRKTLTQEESAEDKIKFDLIRDYFGKINEHDAILVVNPEKNGIKGYIGGNAFLEMGFAHVLNKKLFVLYGLPKMDYSAEIKAMQPTVLNGKLEEIK